jgi:transcriptional regulator with XRE-family HTH domain
MAAWHCVMMPRRANKLSADPIARRLALTRRALGYEIQEEFAREAGITPNAYNTSETGARRLPFNQARRLCERYGLTIEWLYEGVPDRLPHALAMRLMGLGAINGSPDPKQDILRN